MTEVVHLQVADGVATITLDSPANRNALSRRLVGELADRLAAAAADPAVRAVVLTHTGPTFCAGADLSEASSGDTSGNPAAVLAGLLRTIVELPTPVVARLTGNARAGGVGLVGAADIAVAPAGTTFAFTEARLGLSPAVISLTTLPRLDPRAAGRYYLTGEVFDGTEAARIGLLTVASDDVDGALAPILDGLRKGSPQGLAESKLLATAAVRTAFDTHGDAVVATSARLFDSEEANEGMRAFLERRPPRWVG